MRVLVTGADGFIGRNLVVALTERGLGIEQFTRKNNPADLDALVASCDAVVHLAGANRPPDDSGFQADNIDLTQRLATAIRANAEKRRPVLFASSSQVERENPYGASKKAAEAALESIADVADVVIFRLPNVFGKWSRPYYNSAVATFCHQAARGQSLTVNDPAAPLTLVYIDDVVSSFIQALGCPQAGLSYPDVSPSYLATVGEVATTIETMANARSKLGIVETGGGLGRALYATLLSHLPHDNFFYDLPVYGDARGKFVEAVKTPNSGQVSFFTQVPGVERGGHYHHSKSEKFLVVQGKAKFRFRHLLTGEHVEVEASADCPRIVDTIPGWAHDVVNLSDQELIVLIWANEVFDREKPDTIVAKVVP